MPTKRRGLLLPRRPPRSMWRDENRLELAWCRQLISGEESMQRMRQPHRSEGRISTKVHKWSRRSIGPHTTTAWPHHQLSSLSSSACTMTVAAFPRKVRTTPAESQVKSSFRDGLKSRAFFSRSALAVGELFRGKGLPPGPVWPVSARTTSSLGAVNMP